MAITTRQDEAAESSRTAPRPHSAGDPQDRKSQVLTSHTASRVGSISDAVVIKDGEPFFICPPDGQVPTGDDHGFGLYHHDTRFLAGYELTIAGIPPDELAATAVTADRMELELTMPRIDLDSRTIGKERLAVHWTRRLDGAKTRLQDEITIRSYDTEPARLPVHLAFAADFADVFAIRGLLDERPGTLHDPEWRGDRLWFSYSGKDGVDRSVEVRIDPKPEQRADDASCDLVVDVDGRGSASIEVEIRIHEHVRDGARPIEGRRGRQRRDETEAAAAPDDWAVKVTSDSLALDRVIARSLEDLLTLRGALDGRRYYAAGVPWFSTLFGRDSLIAAYQTLAFDSTIAADTLRLLAGRQGTTDDDFRDEKPGKILHELRIGELARLGEVPQSPYYGSIDSTPLFLILLAEHARWVGTLDVLHELRGNVDRALDWIDQSIEENGHGFLSYQSTTKHGLANQGWKDSGDAIVTADGSIATPPIALAEVQGYVFAAWHGIADLLDRDGDAAGAGRLRSKADDLRSRFEERFWSDRLGCYVLALEAEGKPCEVVASNAGQVLWSRIASPERAAGVASRLLEPDVFSGWGIRTLSNAERAANPIGYHLGTVWPHDNGLIADGFRRYGCDDAADRVFVGLLEASTDFPQQRLPECFAGFDRDAFGVPVRYPIACHPQAWAAGAMPHLLTSTLGLVPDGFARRLRVVQPRLPAFLEHVSLEGVPVAGGRVDLAFERADSGTRVTVRRATDGLDVAVEP